MEGGSSQFGSRRTGWSGSTPTARCVFFFLLVRIFLVLVALVTLFVLVVRLLLLGVAVLVLLVLTLFVALFVLVVLVLGAVLVLLLLLLLHRLVVALHDLAVLDDAPPALDLVGVEDGARHDVA